MPLNSCKFNSFSPLTPQQALASQPRHGAYPGPLNLPMVFSLENHFSAVPCLQLCNAWSHSSVCLGRDLMHFLTIKLYTFILDWVQWPWPKVAEFGKKTWTQVEYVDKIFIISFNDLDPLSKLRSLKQQKKKLLSFPCWVWVAGAFALPVCDGGVDVGWLVGYHLEKRTLRRSPVFSDAFSEHQCPCFCIWFVRKKNIFG